MTLAELGVGKTAVITRVGGEGVLRNRFLDMGLIPKTAVTVVKIAPMGDPMEISVRGYELTLRKEDGSRIEVSEDLWKESCQSKKTEKAKVENSDRSQRNRDDRGGAY